MRGFECSFINKEEKSSLVLIFLLDENFNILTSGSFKYDKVSKSWVADHQVGCMFFESENN